MEILIVVAKGYLVILALFMFYLSFKWLFLLDAHTKMLGITINDIAGLNTLKSIMSSGLLMLGSLTVLYLWLGNHWLMPLALSMLFVLIARTLSLLIDGYHHRMFIYAILELVVLVDLYFLQMFE